MYDGQIIQNPNKIKKFAERFSPVSVYETDRLTMAELNDSGVGNSKHN